MSYYSNVKVIQNQDNTNTDESEFWKTTNTEKEMSTPPNDLQQQQILQSSNLTTTTTNQSDNSDKLNLNKSKKITIILKAAGSAPILKTKKWEVDEAWTVAFFQQSLRKLLKLTSDQSLFIFVNQSFSPSPEHTIGTLQKCFGSEGNKLTLYYSTILAWG